MSRLIWTRRCRGRSRGARLLENRSAFTLVEVLVVIAIVGVLIGLLLPAVQTVRENARVAHCRSNLRQVGLGIQMYVDSLGYYPPGNTPRLRAKPEEAAKLGGFTWAISILPYIEQQTVFNTYVSGYNDLVIGGVFAENDRTTNRAVRMANVPIYLCPSDTADGPFNPNKNSILFNPPLEYMPGSYRGMSGRGDGQVFHDGSNYFAPVYRPEWRGAMHLTLPTGLIQERPRNILDGLSNTLLVGEHTDRNDTWGGGAWAYPESYYSLSTAFLDPKTLKGFNACVNKVFENFIRCERGWGSAHYRGINFLLCDGSVRTVPTLINMELFCELATIAGGEPATFEQ